MGSSLLSRIVMPAIVAGCLCTVPASTASRVGTSSLPDATRMCTQRSTSADDLAAMIAAAAGGSTVCVSGRYGQVRIEDVHKAKRVIVRPASGSSASIDLELTDSSGLEFADLTISDLILQHSSAVTFSRNRFTGMSVVLTGIPHARIVFDSNRLVRINARANGYEGRLTIRGDETPTPVGVTIKNNHFRYGCSDGVMVIGHATGVVIGPGNEFDHLSQRTCRAHVDPIQLYGAVATVVRGNYFHDNGDGSGGLESFSGDGPARVTDNVFVCSCIYPFSIAALGGHGWFIAHNTFVGGTVRIANTDSGASPGRNIVRNNVWRGGGLSFSTTDWGTSDHNLNSRKPGVGNVTGTPTFVGGRKPRTYAGYRLAPRSRGRFAASDGGALGIRLGHH
jgi:Right handed beta helix region